MKKKLPMIYAIIGCFLLSISTLGATYAYYAGTAKSEENAIKTGSQSYSISMDIDALEEYTGFSLIPMDNENSMKALNNKCRDKYNRGACNAYTIRVYGYNPELDFISGYMDIETNNMQNISYMFLEEKEEFTEENCININEKNYCISKSITSMGTGEHLPIGDDNYSVQGLEEKNLLLVIWLTNLNERQNEYDIGSFNATVTIQAGNGGEIKGAINSAIKIDLDQTEPQDNP